MVLSPAIITTLLLLSCAESIYADEIPMENVPAYTTAFDANPCCTSCAVIPSASFKSKYCKYHPITDPAPCLCTDPALSIELRSSIWNYCIEKCGASSAPYATSILADYCRLNLPPRTTGQSPGIAIGTPTEGGKGSATVPTATSTTRTSPVTTSAPGGGEDKLSTDGKAGIITGSVTIVIMLLLALAGRKFKWYSRVKAQIRGHRYHAPEVNMSDS
ncbi:hypothetical protein WAI453_003630 [Rhynchosporium graminicola]